MATTDAHVPPGAERLPLRERKKLRTRQALIDTALELFSERGFDGATLDELCDAVEVSKRTFFRNFASKEDVAMAPTQDLWAAFLSDLETRETGGGTVLAMLQASLLAALDRMTDEGWARRVRLSRRLAAETPSMDAHGLHFCDRTARTAMQTLRRRLHTEEPAHDLRLRLALDFLVAAFRHALDAWVSLPGDPDRRALAAELGTAFTAIPEALTFEATPTPA
ncbi:TetR/AcrR family transcriptional regulator [Streptomyces sp. SCA3-4]|uniref:TetR/AcrR family transcriptional regulator n=1 Tax=Streptomyces sichuanensis TaxID=2871810 RepID=UPI001CE32435|nr:TetR family transcriptional regulator [Streptomyces sichuanensis]MCA6091897.1 TetR/AcrR family transcriptional regulator [Streptomyces sichuanensis]